MSQQKATKDASADLLQKQIKAIINSGKKREADLLKMFVSGLYDVTCVPKKSPRKK